MTDAGGLRRGGDPLRRDGVAKTMLSDAKCLAYIARDFVEEAKDLSLEEIMGCMDVVDGGSVKTLSNEFNSPYGKMVFDLVFELKKPDGEGICIDVEIQAGEPSALNDRQLLYLDALSLYWNRDPAKRSYKGKKVYCIWVMLNAGTAKENTSYAMKPYDSRGNGITTLIEICTGDPEGDTSESGLLMDIMFDVKTDPDERLRRIKAQSNIDWKDDAWRGAVMTTMDEFMSEYISGYVAKIGEEKYQEGRKDERESMRAEMVGRYAESVRKAVSEGFSMEKALSLVPEDISDDVRNALNGMRSLDGEPGFHGKPEVPYRPKHNVRPPYYIPVPA